MPEFLKSFTILINTKTNWYQLRILDIVIIASTILFTLLSIRLINKFIFNRIEEYEKSSLILASGVSKPIKVGILLLKKLNEIGNPFYISLALLVNGKFFALEPITNEFFTPIFMVIAGFYVANILKPIFTITISNSLQKDDDDETDKGILQIINLAVSGTVWIAYFFFVANTLKWNLNLIIGSISISSIAIAFAIQNILADIFATFTIFIDKPFTAGDQIVIDPYIGTVKKIGLKSTRIKLLDGDELVVSNKDLTGARIKNLKKLNSRRVIVKLFLNKENSVEKIKKAREIIITSIKNMQAIEYIRVNILELTAEGVVIEYAYQVPDKEYVTYCRVQEEINILILEKLEKEGIGIYK